MCSVPHSISFSPPQRVTAALVDSPYMSMAFYMLHLYLSGGFLQLQEQDQPACKAVRKCQGPNDFSSDHQTMKRNASE